MQTDSDGQMVITPLQLNGLCIKQQSFRQSVEQYKWNYKLEDNTVEDHKDEDDSKDDDKINKDSSDVDNKDNAISPTMSDKKHKYNVVMGMVTSGDDNLMAKFDMAKSYPHLL